MIKKWILVDLKFSNPLRCQAGSSAFSNVQFSMQLSQRLVQELTFDTLCCDFQASTATSMQVDTSVFNIKVPCEQILCNPESSCWPKITLCRISVQWTSQKNQGQNQKRNCLTDKRDIGFALSRRTSISDLNILLFVLWAPMEIDY